MIGKLAGSAIYTAAGIYLIATKPLDLITLIALAGCLAVAVLAATRYSDWVAIGGGMMVAVSLFLQSVLSYWCADCLKADVMIMAGTVVLAILDRGRHRAVIRLTASVMAVMVAATIYMHHKPLEAARGNYTAAGEGAVRSGEVINPPVYPDRYVQSVAADGSKVSLDIAERPVLIFSTSCGGCLRALEGLVGADPEGKRWVPLQVGGDAAAGRQLLREKGYRGDSYVYSSQWHGPVPVMLVWDGVRGSKVNSPGTMIKVVRGDSG